MANLVGIVEPSRLSRYIIKKLTKVPVYSSLNELRNIKYDGVFVLTPPSTHFKIAESLIKDAKHVFMEKPLTLNPKDSNVLLALAKKNKVQLSCGYVYRFHPVILKFKDIITSGRYGKIKTCSLKMLGNVVNEKSPKTWRNNGLGAGCLYDYGCHAIDLSLFLLGHPEEIVCLKKDELFCPGVIDRFTAQLIYKGKFSVTSHVVCDWTNKTVRKAEINIEVITNENKLTTDGQRINVNGKYNENYTIKNLNTNVSYYLRGEEFQNQITDFLNKIDTNRLDYFNTEDAAACDAIISRIYNYKI